MSSDVEKPQETRPAPPARPCAEQAPGRTTGRMHEEVPYWSDPVCSCEAEPYWNDAMEPESGDKE